MLEKQVGGNHYKNFKIQPIEFIGANNLDFYQGNAVKYICRYKNKNGVQDLEKAIHYIELLIDKLKTEEATPVPEAPKSKRSLYDGDCLPPLPKLDLNTKEANDRLNTIKQTLGDSWLI